MRLAENIFFSLQWEWPNTGKPSVFVRFFGCNLCCKWCDSLYAVNNPESIIELSVEEACKQIKSYGCNNIVFTGWETALFEKDIAEIMDKLWDDYDYEIETNWSIPLMNSYTQINISPKLSNSGNKPYPLRALENISFWRNLYSKICFKFVCKDETDFAEVQDYITDNLIPTDMVYIMPMGTDKESQVNKAVLKFCMENNYRYCQRTHIILFWNKKWV